MYSYYLGYTKDPSQIVLLACTKYLLLVTIYCWQGNLVSKASSFPSGIKALADYVHNRGLKLGIYSDAG